MQSQHELYLHLVYEEMHAYMCIVYLVKFEDAVSPI
jgi:hypothetical protein